MIYRNPSLGALAQIFSTIEEPRDNRGKKHRLVDIFILAIIGSLWGHTDFTNMCMELKLREAELTELLGLVNGIPSHDTFSAVFSIINPAEFLECFITWLGELAIAKGHHVAIDGKAVRAACEKIHYGKMPFLVNAYAVDLGICIGQIRVDEKTNEIKGIPELLKYLDLDGSVITIDAIGCQHDIIDELIKKEADYVLAVKENQPTLYHDIELEIRSQIEEKAIAVQYANDLSRRRKERVAPKLNPKFDEYVESNWKHGRMESRHYWLLNDPTCIDRETWETVKSVGMVLRERLVIHRDGTGEIIEEESSREYGIYILSKEMKAEEFACYVRGHWGIENSLHWVLDDYFREDRCTARIGHATENLGLLRKFTFNLLALDPNTKKMSKKAKQIHYRYNMHAVVDLIFNYIPGGKQE